MPSAEWVLPARPVSVPELRARVVSFASANGVPEDVVSDLALAASEALTNSVQHAYPEHDEIGKLTAGVDVDRRTASVVLRIGDDGLGMTLQPASPGFGPGLSLMTVSANDLVVRPGPDGVGTTVVMTFRVPCWLADGANVETTASAYAPSTARSGATPTRTVGRWPPLLVVLGVLVWVAVIYAVIEAL